MRLIKPMQVGFLSRPFEFQRRFQLAITSFVGFGFGKSPPRMIAEMALWPTIIEQLGDRALIDEVMPKARAEILVRGRAYPPGGAPQPTCPIKVEVGSLEKTLYVIGDREWKNG